MDFNQFDHRAHGARGVPLPPPVTHLDGPDCDEHRNEHIRDVVIGRLNANEGYRRAFSPVFLDVARGGPITMAMLGQAIAEFEFTLTFAGLIHGA